jgi:hypothetical protein
MMEDGLKDRLVTMARHGLRKLKETFAGTPIRNSPSLFFKHSIRSRRSYFPIGSKGGETMPGKKHIKGATEKEQRQYEHIKESAERSGRYGSRAKEVAARTVMKQHKKKT